MANVFLMIFLTLCSFSARAGCFLPELFLCGDTNKVTLYGEVTQKSAHQVITDIQDANKQFSNEPIWLYIDSPGGSVIAGGSIVNAIEASRRPVNTVVVGMAASMAAYVEIYGAKRYMAPRSILMFHNASTGLSGELPQLRSQLALFTRLIALYTARLEHMTGLSAAEIAMHSNEEWWMLPDDALANHLIDGVLNPGEYPAP